jgi:hypothetical protein
MFLMDASNTRKDHSDTIEDTIHDDDKVVIQNILTGIDSLGTDDVPICKQYKVVCIPSGYMIYAKLPSQDIFEISTEDLLFLQSISPARIENISIGRISHGSHNIDLYIKVLNHEQKIMIKSNTSFFTQSTRKRRFKDIS